MLKGISVSDGIGIGKAYIVRQGKPEYTPVSVADTEAEAARFHQAVTCFCERTEEMAENMEQTVGQKDAAIIRGHIQMLKDPYMLAQIEEQIKEGTCAEAACENVLNTFIEMFSQVDDELTRQRATDVEDIKIRMLGILLGTETQTLRDIPPESVLVTEDLTPSMTAEMESRHVVGIVTEKGGKTSHSAILARALEIPAVLSVSGAAAQLKAGDTVIVDGREGLVVPQPDQRTLSKYRKQKAAYEAEQEVLCQYIGRETVTADGERKEVCCNIGNLKDAAAAAEKDGEGIGLFRSEFLFMDKKDAPGEEEQFAAYKKAAEVFKGKPVIIRTLDVGGDKGIPYLSMGQEDNPFLGFRGIRYCLAHGDLYDTQLRAIIRASAFGKVRIMVPLVTGVDEIRAVREKVQIITREFEQTGVEYDRNLQVGIMVETPAASLIADLLAEESDFFSIGTNDLTQYTMAADRGNSQVAYLNNPYEPAVLRSIRRIIRCGKEAGIPVGMCGEAAADPLLTPLLLAFGLDEFSVSPASVLATRYNISKWTKREAEAAADQVMKLKTADAVKAFLINLNK
ncbi:phosphoenolpyruvate--protein phosphotransferase [Anaerovorax odorimutans]|uniref:Phosphoenolpyruvate-protein phosphotransferase n=1 Tax=Anaerovorax odorimutans TaxID=109327 RepID=A0ABT1RSS8_9FIRM|nr:phosphoenolpyruvate--protein phosphotransferase [Anaerovorax odorimutans]MCQ4638256.1 phosphoenolpyruvate--protein phosphotransferase [Anaerovorax odorimutans]